MTDHLGPEYALFVGVGVKPDQTDSYDVSLEDSFYDYTLSNMIQCWLRKPDHSVQLLGPRELEESSKKRFVGKVNKDEQDVMKEIFSRTYLFRDEDQPRYSRMALCSELARKLRTVHSNQRYYIPWEEFLPRSSKKLILKRKSKTTARALFENIRASEEYILLPYLFKSAGFHSNSESVASLLRIEEFGSWISPNLRETLPPEQILFIYEELTNFLDVLMRDSPYDQFWKVEKKNSF